MLFGMVFGFFWLTSFILACSEFAVIGSAVTWYFSDKRIPDDDGIPGDSDVMKAIWWTYRYNAGSLALGSFILAIVWTIRAIFEYIGNKVEGASGDNGCTKCLISCIRCCLDCFDRMIRYLNRNAYIYCCITANSFCPSALEAFLLILKNAAKFAMVESIAGAFIFLAKSFVAVVTTLIGYFLLGYMTETEVDPIAPCACIFILSYLVGSQFISIFDVGANTIL